MEQTYQIQLWVIQENDWSMFEITRFNCMYVMGYQFCFCFYNFSIGLWNCSDTVVSLYNYGPLCKETSRFVNLRGKQPSEGWQIWMFPYTEGRNCFIIFLPMFYKLSPLWGKLGCLVGNNRVVSQQCKFWQNISIILLSHD